DPDLSDTVTASVTGVVATGTVAGLVPDNATLQGMLSVTSGSIAADPGATHNLHWGFDSGSEAFNYLNSGQHLTLTYTVAVSDGHGGTDDQTVVVAINGSDDVVPGPQAVGDHVIYGAGITSVVVPEWALLFNDPSTATDVGAVGGAIGGTVSWAPG